MTESFSDLWASSGSTKSQQLPIKSLLANTGNNPNASRRTTPDTFSILASAGSSRPSSRPMTPSAPEKSASSKAAQSNPNDAFGGLVSFGGLTSREDGLTIAERTAKAARERKEQAEQTQATFKTQDTLWDQLETISKPTATSSTQALFDITITEPSAKASGERKEQAERKQATFKSQDILWDQLETISKPIATPSTEALVDTWDFDLLTDSKQPSRSNTPGSFGFGDGETAPWEWDEATKEAEDDILGSLAKPVEESRRTSSRLLHKLPSPTAGALETRETHEIRASSPPPHVIGRIVEMGFSVQQAKTALAATDSGLDVDSALEILLRNVESEVTGREMVQDNEAAVDEVNLGRRPRQAPRTTAMPPEVSTHPTSVPGTQQGLQDQADKLLAQASTIGLSMFNKANAFWKEGREKVAKVYEEQRTANSGRGRWKDTGRPRWMDESMKIDDAGEGPMQKIVDAPLKENLEKTHSDTANTRPATSQTRSVFPSQMHSDTTNMRPAASSQTRSALSSQARSDTTNMPPAPSEQTHAVIHSEPRHVRPSRPLVPLSPSAAAASNAHKEIGGEHFKLGRFAESEAAYSSAIAELPHAHLLRVPLYNNRALTRLRTGDYKGSVVDAGEAIQLITGDLGSAWYPETEIEGEATGVNLGAALGKALRRRAEAYEGMEKWTDAMADWERLRAMSWVPHPHQRDAIKGVNRCRGMLNPGTIAVAPNRRVRRSSPVITSSTSPSEALSRVRDANAAQEAEDQARHDVKDAVDSRLAVWRTGKETNLRALIASLDTVLWPELGWQKVGMAELVSPGQVKVRYTKAISKLHPDKLHAKDTTVEQRMIANGVFGTLNEAWNAFR